MEFVKDNVAALQSRIIYIQESLSRIAFLKTSLQGNCSQVRLSLRWMYFVIPCVLWVTFVEPGVRGVVPGYVRNQASVHHK